MPAIVNAHVPVKAPVVRSPKVCPVSHAEFCRNAAPVPTQVAGQAVKVGPFEFSTGSFGWRGNGRCTVKLANGQEVACSVTVQIVVDHSKTADRTATAEDETESVE